MRFDRHGYAGRFSNSAIAGARSVPCICPRSTLRLRSRASAARRGCAEHPTSVFFAHPSEQSGSPGRHTVDDRRALAIASANKRESRADAKGLRLNDDDRVQYRREKTVEPDEDERRLSAARRLIIFSRSLELIQIGWSPSATALAAVSCSNLPGRGRRSRLLLSSIPACQKPMLRTGPT